MGNFEGIASKIGPVYANDALVHMLYRYHSAGGDGFFGFSANGRSDNAGDPEVDSILEKARSEFGTAKRVELVHKAQRYLAQKMYAIHFPGGANQFQLVSPQVQNWRAFDGDQRARIEGGESATYLWLKA